MRKMKFYERAISFEEGWFVVTRENGERSLVTHRRAREIEAEYRCSLATMDCSRGGMDKGSAYRGHGLYERNGRVECSHYEVDSLINGGIVRIGPVLEIPETIGGMPVTFVERRAFAEEAIETVVIHGRIGRIEEEAFAECRALRELRLANKDTFLGRNAVRGTMLCTNGGFSLGGKLVQVDSAAAGEVSVREGTRVIGEGAFSENATILGVVLPEGVHTIERMAFFECTELRRIALPSSLRRIDEMAFASCYALKEIVFPQRLDVLGAKAFQNCRELESISLPEGVADIEPYTFFLCRSLREVRIPATVRRVGREAFSICPKLERVTIEGAETELEEAWIGVRYDKQPIAIIAPEKSHAMQYCRTHAETVPLIFKPL